MTPEKKHCHSTKGRNIAEFSMQDVCLQCFDAVGWAAGRASGLYKKLSGGVLAWFCLERCRLAYGPADATATHCLLLQ